MGMGFIGIILSWTLSEGGRWGAGMWHRKSRRSMGAGTRGLIEEVHYIVDA